MVKVSVEVHNGAARLCVAVRAESVRRAVSLVRGRDLAAGIGLKFPADPEGFFLTEPAPRAGMAEQPRKVAA